MKIRVIAILICIASFLLLNSSLSHGTNTDVNCLKTLKASVEDPLNYLNSWNFSDNSSLGFICKFAGVGCWNPIENRVLNIQLSNIGLKGQFPKGLANCTSLTGLNLSNNQFSGPIPSKIGKFIPFLTILDLSSNNFSGKIPLSLPNCSYLNVLKLNNNRLEGRIPSQIGNLRRLRTFSVANNLLSGRVPSFGNRSFPVESYANNSGLCGKPLEACKGEISKDLRATGNYIKKFRQEEIKRVGVGFCSWGLW